MLVSLVRYNLRPLVNKERLALSTMSLLCRAQRLARVDVDLGDYKSCCTLYKKSCDLRALSERLMDRALHMKLPVDDRLVQQLQTVVVVCETLEQAFMDNAALAGRLLARRPAPHRPYFDEPDPPDACPICCEGGRLGTWVVCSDCDQDPVCAQCAARMTACPYCRSTKSYAKNNTPEGQL
jgi:hypothetical protein